MRLEDWREWSAERLAPLFAHQVDRWRTELSWDAASLFGMIARAREAGQLPGLVAIDDSGEPAGWSYASVQDGLLFIGALHGDRADVVRALLDAMLASAEASYSRGYRCFIYPDSPAVAAALTRRRFELQPFLYLHRSTSAHPVEFPVKVRAWSADDVPETARLLARAYAGTSDGRCFAPGGRLEEWAGYLAQIVRTPGCGTFAPDESFACLSDDPDPQIVGVLVATRLSRETTHVAQVAVDPRWRGRGLAAALIDAAAARGAATGASRQTLLVAEPNGVARALYARLGFQQSSYFLFAERARISRTAPGTAWTAGESSAQIA